jgi:glucose/mannose-6-phosphate isomerase
MLDFPNQLEKAWTSLWVKDLPVKMDGINNVLVSGMGGSGIPGTLIAELFADKTKLPITPWADYGLPSWANQSTLLIAVSCSGNTEEGLDVVKRAVELKLPIIVITSGGKLAELAGIHGFPLVSFEYNGSPRAALGWLYGSLITVLAKLGVVDINDKAYFQALEELKTIIAQKQFPAKAEGLAVTLNNKVPVILAHAPLTAVAKRYQNQFNENSKTFAMAAPLPEACHNFVVGLDFAIPEKLVVLFLESKFGFSRNIARKKILEKLFESKDIAFVPLSVKSGSPLAEQLLFIHFGDLLSFYLAGVYGVDPTPIESIDFLKGELGKL